MGRSSATKCKGLWAVVLAAGGSSRLGRPKQLLRFRGQPLIIRATALARQQVGRRVVVVLGAERLRLRLALGRREPSARVVVNGRWRSGLASSLRTGLDRLPRQARGALILLVDQPGIEAADLTQLCRRWRRRPGRPAAALYAGRASVPAVIPRRFLRAARAVDGDVGLRAMLRSAGGLTLVAMPAGSFDVDTPQDAARLSAAHPTTTRLTTAP